MSVNRLEPTSENRMPLYAICTPDRWGLRYSDEENGTLAYPVARDYAKTILQVLITQVQWGDAYFGPAWNMPTLRLRWPLDDDAKKSLFLLIKPVIAKALTSTTSLK